MMRASTLITAKIAVTRLPASAVQGISVRPKVRCFCELLITANIAATRLPASELFPGCYRRHSFHVVNKLTIPADAGRLYDIASVTHESI